MAARSKRSLRTCALAILIPAHAFGAPASLRPQGVGVQTIYHASGARSGGGLTTMVSCTNVGNVAGTIGISLYEFDGSFVCSAFAGAVNRGETRTLSAGAIASMANVAVCGGGTQPLHQGHVEIWAQQTETLHWYCTAQLVAAAGDPPKALTRLTLFNAAGALPGDVIFADGFDP